jgi:hypothetical protein
VPNQKRGIAETTHYDGVGEGSFQCDAGGINQSILGKSRAEEVGKVGGEADTKDVFDHGSVWIDFESSSVEMRVYCSRFSNNLTESVVEKLMRRRMKFICCC